MERKSIYEIYHLYLQVILIMIQEINRESHKRIPGLDVYRMLSVLFVFLFHTHIHLGCQYGILNDFINMGAIFMTAFFLLSGHLSFFTNYKINLFNINNTKRFYIKKIIAIIPLYYVSAV